MEPKVCLFAALCAVLVAVPAVAQAPPQRDAYKYSQPDENAQVAVPDVDKAAGAVPPDNSCWQATAANLLAGAGWGKAGNTPQQNANAIYGHMTTHFGLAPTGSAHIAANWWLMMVGKNPDAATNPDIGYYNPTHSYSDVTYQGGYIDSGVYDSLLDELNRCQYVGVAWQKPGAEVGHSMTLVGGNKAGNPNVNPGGDTSIWHDSNRDIGNGPDGVNDDQLQNWWVNGGVAGPAPGQWWLDYNNNGVYDPPEATDPDWEAQNWTTLCEGEHKPQDAVENYDIAYFKDLNPNWQEQGEPKWINVMDVRGANDGVYGAPQLDDQEYTLLVENEEMPDPWYKEVWLLVDYLDRENEYIDPTTGNPYAAKDILLEVPIEGGGTATLDPSDVTWNADLGQLLYYWRLDDQPSWETIVFPDANYVSLTGDVKDWNVATLCTPEPATLALVTLGAAAALLRRRRKS
jgi:hypothetical protein